jgi:hypothetical protein
METYTDDTNDLAPPDSRGSPSRYSFRGQAGALDSVPRLLDDGHYRFDTVGNTMVGNPPEWSGVNAGPAYLYPPTQFHQPMISSPTGKLVLTGFC